MLGKSLEQIGPGSRLRLLGMDVTVTSSIDLTSEGWSWQEHQILGHAWVHWLTVEMDEGQLLCATWTERPDLVEVSPGGRKLKVDGLTFRREDDGRGTYAMRDGSDHGDYEYYDYECDDQMLSFDRYGDGPWEASLGRAVPTGQIQVIA